MEEDEFFVLSESEDDGDVQTKGYGLMMDKSSAPVSLGEFIPDNSDEGTTTVVSGDRTSLSIDEVIFGDTVSNSKPLRMKAKPGEIKKDIPIGIDDIIINSNSISISSNNNNNNNNNNSGSGESSSMVGLSLNGGTSGVGISSLYENSEDKQETMIDISLLRSMTCADVRALLEPFFQRKEIAKMTFDKAKENLLLEEEEGEITPSMRKVNRIMLERWRRLVNISNWNDGNPLRNDVLFPEVLLPPLSLLLSSSSSSLVAGDSTTSTTNNNNNNNTEISTSTTRKLRPHQIEGIRFLWSILAEGPVGKVPAVGCILAHTMGLGKTCQVVIFLHLYMRQYNYKERKQRVLLVVPKSTRSGWNNEFTTWSQYFPVAHRIKPIVMDERESMKKRIEMYTAWKKEGGILLVGYEMVLGLVKNDTNNNNNNNNNNNSSSSSMHTMKEKSFYTDLLICDEAHRLKSTKLQISVALRSLHPLRRLLLTGTPLQNHLQEYWAMVDFALHKYFEQRRFQEFFINPIEASVHSKASPREVAAARMKTFTLIRELRHFVQRVDSTPLQDELPPLHEYVVVVSLSPLQSRLYNDFLKLVREEQSRYNFLQAVTYANKISAHPQLLFASDPSSPVKSIRGEEDDNSSSSDDDDDEEEKVRKQLAIRSSTSSFKPEFNNRYIKLCQPPSDYIPKSEDGAKLHVAINIIKAALLRGEKTLLFSLSTKLLDLFETTIAEKNQSWQKDGSLSRPIRYCRLDGSHSGAEREDTLRSFASTQGADVFLLSMKAGGVGITITAATRVILLDTGFNPADDRQAIGRAYRYGQTKPVFVYRLMCHQTFEHRMFEQKVAKEWLFRTIVEEASLKRDALAGLGLQSMFQLLGRAHAVKSNNNNNNNNNNKPTLTKEQENSTAKLLEEDVILADVAEHILYAESHEVYLQHDERVQYGTEERAFYDEYQKNGVFYVDHHPMYGDENNETHRFGRQREKHQQEIVGQTKTLTALVDDIIRSRAENDPQLRHILRMMGVTVDESGTVMLASKQQQQQQQQRVEEKKERETQYQQQQQQQKQRSYHGKRDKEEEEEDDDDDPNSEWNSTSSSSRRKIPRNEKVSRLRPVVLDESDDDSILLLDGKKAPVPLVDPSKYEQFRPGRDAKNAIFIDEDEV
ncbi:helicase-like protein [Trypanosoma theileri]|uniref:Helicase-like protein n=1 Tax=Trypanosoma theileri TaxID=67003 RepID=A0A1X0NX57_9TRYP|nr:helicase-like protein [Trypanosoma theileri]ORC88700.1 helicase-like protein [Trypanosoma theileri]